MPPADNDVESALPEERYGWVMVVVAAVFLGAASGALSSISVFLKPLTAELGGLRGATSFAYTAGFLASGVGGILMGYLNDRFTTRAVVFGGALALGVAYLLLSVHQSLWQLYLFFVLMGGLGVAAFRAPLIANVGIWFNRNKGLALGLTTAGQALGQGFVPFVAGLLIPALGWRAAYVVLGVATLGLLVPLSAAVRTPPGLTAVRAGADGPKAPAGAAPPIPPGQLVAWLSAAVVFCCVCMSTALVHVVALAQDAGMGAEQAAGIIGLVFATSFVGRIGFGRLADRIGGARAYFIASAGQTSLVFWFTQMNSLWGFYLLAVAFGLFFSGVMTCLVITVREMTPMRRRGLSQAIISLFGSTGMGLGGFQGGLFFDLTGSYTLPFAIAAAAGVCNLIVVGALVRRLRRPAPADPALQPV